MAYTKTNWEDLPSEDTPILSTALQNIEDGIEDIDIGKVNKTDIVDNLTTNDATKVLSAKQGKVLDEKFSEVVLYDNSTGSNGSLTFSESKNNFKYISIHARVTDQKLPEQRFLATSGTDYCQLGYIVSNSGSNNVVYMAKMIVLSGTSLTINPYAVFIKSLTTTSNSISVTTPTDEIYITKVIGIK